MKIVAWRHPSGMTNFGDELNHYLWPQLLPAAKFEGEGLLCGIGTIMQRRNRFSEPVVVFGSGAGFDLLPPEASSFEVFFVRGPKTAKLFDDPEIEWITDPALLVHHFVKREGGDGVKFMPHWSTLVNDPGLTEESLRSIGIKLIDPRWPVERCLQEIATADKVLAEAMHGAIVADALRVPWVPIYAQHGHLFKWLDWTASVGMHYDPELIEVASLDWINRNTDGRLSSEWMMRQNLRELDKEVIKLQRRLS